MIVAKHVRHARTALLAGAIVAAAGLPARADTAAPDTISAEGAQRLQQQLHDWLAGVLGPHVPLDDQPFRVTADSDHYRLEISFPTLPGVTLTGDPFAADLKPLDGGRWGIDNVRIPSPLHGTFPAPNGNGPGKPGTASTTITVAAQDQHAVLDPGLATPSHWDSNIKGYKAVTTGVQDGSTQTTSVDEMTVHMAWDPAPDGRLNISEEGDGHLMTTNATMPDVGLVSFSAEHVHGTVHFDGLAPDQLTPLIHAVMELAPLGAQAAKGAGNAPDLHALAEQNRKEAEADRKAAEADKQAVADGRMTPEERRKNTEDRIARAKARRAAMQAAHGQGFDPSTLTPGQRAAVHDALVAFANLLGGFDEQGTLDNVHFVVAGHSGHVQKLAAGFGAGAPDGKVGLHFHLALDGLDSPDVPPGVFRDDLPRHISLTPRLGGVPATDLRDLLLRAADSGGKDPLLDVQARALLDKGPVTAGLDEVSLDFGPATLHGAGEVRFRSSASYEGEAHVTATGLDALIQQANGEPQLAQAAPVLFLLKGMGRQNGDTTVWDVTFRDNKVLVNGNDLSQMLPGNK